MVGLEIPKRGMPVTIITGFLGSGKTTLLNHILKNNQDLKIAVLVNEFGDINIDSQLLVSIDEDMMELTNGCICCTINDSLIDAVYRVLERPDKIDYLVVETTGIADPFPIALTFLSQDLRDLTRLDSILTLVDCETFTPSHYSSSAAHNQIAYGDIIILNKIDLAPEGKIQSLENYIHSVKAGARILKCNQGIVPLPLILDVELTKIDTYSNIQTSHHHDHHHHDHNHSHHLENDGFVSVSFESDQPFYVNKFQDFLQQKLPENVFRAKGLIWFIESPHRHIFQLSGKRFELQEDKWTGQKRNQLVFIGRNLDADELRRNLNACIANAYSNKPTT
ncbi:GTP-binding protein [Ancylothrix sp. C2]|uniref:CobW family GTP-binding protein n=1 Tax=Ancylothrix sp. D3o TaxID=2953691 RepID=UPI0021BB88E3|nr:GTP-binding protein [Ancylothrix sp. D3o]MCT7949283.1 GTP-binding protein [Ancylothrix sp. D3o]